MFAMPKFSLLLPAVLILIVAILIIHQRVRYLNGRCEEFDVAFDKLRADIANVRPIGGCVSTSLQAPAPALEPLLPENQESNLLVIKKPSSPLPTPPEPPKAPALPVPVPVTAPKALPVPAQPAPVVPNPDEQAKKSCVSTENELVELLKTVEAIQDVTKAPAPPPPKKGEEEKQLKQILRAKGITVKGTIEELRSRVRDLEAMPVA